MKQCLLGVFLLSCATNQSGHLEAPDTGDTSHPLERGSPIDELRAACGDGALLDTGAMVHRRPYLQQVGTAKAKVGWVAVAATDEVVDLASSDRSVVGSAPGVIQPGDQRLAGEEQMWATLDGLAPHSIYCYQLSNGGVPVANPTGFRTAPERTDPGTIRFLAFGDSGGGGADQLALRDTMFEYPFDFIIHTGDVAYDNGTIGQFEDNVFGVYSELFENLAFFPAPGNHDKETMQGAPFRQVFSLPIVGDVTWYSYDWGNLHLAALDTEADYATQAAWLDADLAATTQPWKIVYLHRPPYSSGAHGSDTRLRGLLAPVLERHGVQLVLAGHDHDYERVNPQNGVNYVVTGGGGKGTRAVGTSSFTAFSADVIHFVIVEITGDQLTLHAIDATGQEFDSLVVMR